MNNIIQLALKRPVISIIILLLIIVFGAYNLKELNIDTSERSLIIQNDPELDYYDEPTADKKGIKPILTKIEKTLPKEEFDETNKAILTYRGNSSLLSQGAGHCIF